MKFADIEKFVREGNYEVNMPLEHLEDVIVNWIEDDYYRLNLDPDFQRGHVWTEDQQTAYVEYFLRGGKSGVVLYFNKPGWMSIAKDHDYDDFVIVDGLQRLTALRKFMRGDLKAFGNLVHEFEDEVRMSGAAMNLRLNINNLQTKKHVLSWYLEMNSGGTPHTDAELNKVKGLLEAEDCLVKHFSEMTP